MTILEALTTLFQRKATELRTPYKVQVRLWPAKHRIAYMNKAFAHK